MGSDPRQHLIASATALLADEGVEAVTLRRIAREAGVSHGAPLRHFAGRTELLSAVASTGFAELRRRGETSAGATAAERLRAACLAYLDFALGNPAMFELMFRHDLIDAHAPELAGTSDALFTGFCELVRGAQEEQGWRTGTDSRLLAASLWSALHGLAELWLWGELGRALKPDEIDAVLRVTLETYLR
ncbi:TetR/AcrR family transcriptional regulator [Prauserella muralis]|uniref:TetR family transcriptional regulator n=1 Tax=Prauserella muralis TaxID=588067 RepID=A0A2V4ANT2_9PSEU|nr:TetR/AcrR family transcriptional regulator [Prauserella muralis]PXY21299.1 TetR family transcriptional regulator [Prauserella muralis]TWE30420.1 TetR family transcriptional regulator [Prauserella muralis]